ncbi:lipid asymmetry maintenance protein MlaB [Actinoplanes sp. NPDC051343]|uniref:lipid asymmetry maintenance protein MlaB n=1 Tax=Actinoplanes sp. NPDC051343 TaxID=3363906 RepID=UPI0037B7F9C2
MRVAVDDELTIVTAAAHRETLLAALRDGSAVRVELSGISDLDTAGLQVLLLLRDEAARLHVPVEFAAPSPAVAEVLALTGLEL